MRIGALIPEALRALGAHPLRTLLAMLGMIIGVAAVVLMLAIGEGSRERVAETMATMGANIFNVQSGAPRTGGLRHAAGSSPTLSIGDAEAIAELPSVQAIAPAHWGFAQMQFEDRNWSTSVYGSTPAFAEVRNWRIAQGMLFGPADLRSAAQKVVLGATVARELFGARDPVGRVLRIKGQPYQVVGVFRAKGDNLNGRDQDDMVLVPLTTAQRKLFGHPFPGMVRFMAVKARSAAALGTAKSEIRALLRQRHGITAGLEDDFTLRDLTARAEAAAETARSMSLLLGAIASISLLVGGIGIMNVMLMSVTERTREIGIRMAVGARRSDILVQFIIEAILICLVGGLLGCALGVAAAWIAASAFEMTVVVRGAMLALAFGFAAAVGLFFGFHPARKAAWLPPVAALRQ